MKETIEQAAKQYSSGIRELDKKNVYDNIDVDSCRMVAFKAGARWQAEKSPWISVEERKPKHMQAVWVKSDINNHQQLRFCDGKFYTSFAHQTYDGSVTHWMPIPE